MNVGFPDSDSDIRSTVSLRNDPSVPSRRVSRVHVQFCNVLLDFQVGHQVFDIGRDCIWASVFPFWKSCSLCCLTRIAIRGNDDLSVVCGFTGWSNPAAFVFRIEVSLDPYIYVGSISLSDVAQMSFEDMSVENVCFEGKFEFAPSGADESDRFAL